MLGAVVARQSKSFSSRGNVQTARFSCGGAVAGGNRHGTAPAGQPRRLPLPQVTLAQLAAKYAVILSTVHRAVGLRVRAR